MLRNIIKTLKLKLKDNPYFISEKVYIRGSCALGKETDRSDVDLLIVSEDFEGVNILKRKLLVSKAMDKALERELDVMCLRY